MLTTLVDALFDTMYAASGRGLAAPQIGVSKRVFVVDVSWKDGTRDPQAFLNPEILTMGEDTEIMDEMCLSIPGVPMPVQRPKRIEMRWCSLEGKSRTSWFDGISARCIQHEYDHLNGKVIFDHQPAEDRESLETAYAP